MRVFQTIVFCCAIRIAIRTQAQLQKLKFKKINLKSLVNKHAMVNERRELLDMILSMDEYTFERFSRQTEDDEDCEWFESFEEYKEFNRQFIDQLNDNDVSKYNTVASLIKSGTIHMVDEEVYVVWEATSCFFTPSGQFVIMHPR